MAIGADIHAIKYNKRKDLFQSQKIHLNYNYGVQKNTIESKNNYKK